MTTATEKRNAIVAWMAKYVGKFSYTNDHRRTDPLKYFATDCSGSIRQAYLDCAGIDIGLRSFNIAERGRCIASVRNFTQLPTDKMRPGDVLCMAFPYGRFAHKISHVELYVGKINGVPMTLGHGGPGSGPTFNRLNQKYITGSASYIAVQRFIEDDQEGDDELTPDQSAKLDWIYTNLKAGNYPFGWPEASHNLIGRVLDRLTELEKKIDSIGK